MCSQPLAGNSTASIDRDVGGRGYIALCVCLCVCVFVYVLPAVSFAFPPEIRRKGYQLSPSSTETPPGREPQRGNEQIFRLLNVCRAGVSEVS